MRVLLSFIFTLLLCLNSFSQSLPDCDEIQLSISPNECIIVGDEIEVISSTDLIGIIIQGGSFFAPIQIGPSPFIYQFDDPGEYTLIGYNQGFFGPYPVCTKNISIADDELSIEVVNDLELCSGSSLEIDDILLEINGESNFFLNQYVYKYYYLLILFWLRLYLI